MLTSLSPNECTIHTLNTQGPTRASPSAFALVTELAQLWKQPQNLNPQHHRQQVSPKAERGASRGCRQTHRFSHSQAWLHWQPLPRSWNRSGISGSVCAQSHSCRKLSHSMQTQVEHFWLHRSTSLKQKALTLFIGKGILTLPCSQWV